MQKKAKKIRQRFGASTLWGTASRRKICNEKNSGSEHFLGGKYREQKESETKREKRFLAEAGGKYSLKNLEKISNNGLIKKKPAWITSSDVL